MTGAHQAIEAARYARVILQRAIEVGAVGDINQRLEHWTRTVRMQPFGKVLPSGGALVIRRVVMLYRPRRGVDLAGAFFRIRRLHWRPHKLPLRARPANRGEPGG